MEYITVDRIFSKLHRDLKGIDFNESDVIEMIGEALDFLKIKGNQEEAVSFLNVKDYHAELPCGFQMVLQIARNNYYTPENNLKICPEPTITEEEVAVINRDCCSDEIPESTHTPVPYNLNWSYQSFTNSPYYKALFTPVRLSNNTFFNSLVCKEFDESPYHSCDDEYTIVGHTERRLRFSFKEGRIALSFLKTILDPETGYPLIPDQVSYITAITYYIKWKIAESHQWSGRQGFAGLAEASERRWLKYVSQAKNYTFMPKTLDDYQDLLEMSHRLIPSHRRYYGYFGKMTKEENRDFNNPSRNNY